MSSIKLSPNASGTGIFTIAAPNSNTDRTLTLPDQTGTVLTNAGPFTANASASNGAVTIDASNNVGIGTSSPNARLDAYAAANFVGVRASSGSNALTLYANSSGTQAGLYTDNANPILFWNSGTERMRIDTSGNLLVGTTSAGGKVSINNIGGSQGTSLFINGWGSGIGSAAVFTAANTSNADVIYFNTSAAIVGKIAITSTATSYVTSSDYRLKENVQPMTGALAKVALLKPCTYTWKADGTPGQGFIAHELAEVVPDAVVGEKDAVDADGNIVPQGIDTSFLVATLTAALQELNAKVEAQAAEIAALKGAK